jgi:hypothetical protein
MSPASAHIHGHLEARTVGQLGAWRCDCATFLKFTILQSYTQMHDGSLERGTSFKSAADAENMISNTTNAGRKDHCCLLQTMSLSHTLNLATPKQHCTQLLETAALPTLETRRVRGVSPEPYQIKRASTVLCVLTIAHNVLCPPLSSLCTKCHALQLLSTTPSAFSSHQKSLRPNSSLFHPCQLLSYY